MTMPRFSKFRASSSGSPQASASSEVYGYARQVNDSLYELSRPEGTPNVQVVFFHGLQPGDYSDAHLSTWRSGYGYCIWPQTWLVEEFPAAQVFSVSYSGGLEMYNIGENLVHDLVPHIGQVPYCPVVLVGHSIGGLVIKDFCIRALNMLNSRSGSDRAKLETFLQKVQGVFYYATPHHGSHAANILAKKLPSQLKKYLKTLSKDTARLNSEFDGIFKQHYKWLFASVGETLRTTWGLLKVFVVPEASAREGDFNAVEGADHFSICRPRSKSLRNFSKLKEFVGRIVLDMEDANTLCMQQEEASALEDIHPENLQNVHQSVIGIDHQVEEIIGKLHDVRTLGLVGMGGLGKTTIAKKVFNELASQFAYTCFVPDVKLIKGNVKEAVWECMHYSGKKMKNGIGQFELRRKKLLLVLDDVSSERDENILSELCDSTHEDSRFIFTSRNQRPLEDYDDIYMVKFLNNANAMELFLSHAFPNHRIPPTKLEWLIEAVVKKCEGLPLTLEVLGKYLRTKKYDEDWKQTLHALNKAEDVTDFNERLWAKLRPSYDSLEEKLQQLFLESTTFFSDRAWTLRKAKAAWRVAYDTRSENLLWQKLVDMSLVYDVGEDEHIRVHEQLQSLGRMIASQHTNNGKRREWDGEKGLKLLQNIEELLEPDIISLRLGTFELTMEARDPRDDLGHDRLARQFELDAGKIRIASTTILRLKKLQYFDVNARNLVVDGAQDCLPLLRELVTLRCFSPELAQALLHPALQTQLVVLALSWEMQCLPTYLGSFSALRFFYLHKATHLKSIPDEMGHLSQLEVLRFYECNNLQTLPESLGQLKALRHLSFLYCEKLSNLPESLGKLEALTHIQFYSCGELCSLPESFGQLKALQYLKFYGCAFHGLPRSFGQLKALNVLLFHNCGSLKALPESFGHLKALRILDFQNCESLKALPESFGDLSALSSLKFLKCTSLRTLPESFGDLCALNILQFLQCTSLHTLPKSFCQLASCYIEFMDCDNLRVLDELARGTLPLNLDNIEFGESCVL